MHHEFISVRAPKPFERFVWREAASVIRRECPADGYESGNGSSGFSFQLVQSVRHSIVRLTETLETHKNSPRFDHGKSIHFCPGDWRESDIPAHEFSMGGVHFDVLGGKPEENRNTILAAAKEAFPLRASIQNCVR